RCEGVVSARLYHRRQTFEYTAPVRNVYVILFSVRQQFCRYDSRPENLTYCQMTEAYAKNRQLSLHSEDQLLTYPGVPRMPGTGRYDQMGRLHFQNIIDSDLVIPDHPDIRI